MICPICNQKVPFGLQLHMLAAHGPNRAEYQRRSAQMEKENSADGRKRSQAKRRRGQPSGKKMSKHPRHSKLS